MSGVLYNKTILENGIRVITDFMPEVRSVSIGVLIDAGPRDETLEKSGLAHLTEHLIFQGTINRNAMQIAQLIDAAGGQMGAFTARDYTCFTTVVLDDYGTYILDLLGDILINSTFPSESVAKEKEAILREMDGSRDMPHERAHTALKHFIWPNHPLGRPVAGNHKSVDALTRDDVLNFAKKNYLPKRTIIAAAGNVEHQDFAAQVRDAFWLMSGTNGSPPLPPPCFNSGVTIEHMQVSQAYFAIGIPAFSYTHPERYALHVMNRALGGGISSRLFRRMREERGLVYDISSEYHAYRDSGVLVIEGSTVPEHLIQVIGLTLVEVWQLITGDEPVNEEELWKSRMQIRGQHIIASENTNTRMSRLTTQELYFGRHITANEILEQIDIVDIRRLERLADEILTDSLRYIAIAVVGPEAPEYYTAASIENLLAEF